MFVTIIIIILIGSIFEYFSSLGNSNKSSKDDYDFFDKPNKKSSSENKKYVHKEFIKKELSEPKESTCQDKISDKNNSVDDLLRPKKISVAQEFKKHGVETIWHMTHKNNVRSILEYGISSNKRAASVGNVTDISNQEVQFLRSKKDVFYNRDLHEYTPTYINIKNPMLYVKRDINEDLCLLEISISCLSNNNFVFTDGNAASLKTKMFCSAEDIKHLPWEVLESSYWNDFPDGKRQMCAEVLVYPEIKPEHIKTVYCYSQKTFFEVNNKNFKFKIDKNMYF